MLMLVRSFVFTDVGGSNESATGFADPSPPKEFRGATKMVNGGVRIPHKIVIMSSNVVPVRQSLYLLFRVP
jgi:hypothetical protein